MNLLILKRILLIKFTLTLSAFSAVLPHQGRVLKKNGETFDGIGYFQFALVSHEGDIRWAHDNSLTKPGNQSISIGVNNGFYQVKLGDVSISGMEPLPDDLFVYEDPLSLRIYFSDGNSTPVQLGPDQPLNVSPYAITTRFSKADETLDLLDYELEELEKASSTNDKARLIENLVLISSKTPNEDNYDGTIRLEMLDQVILDKLDQLTADTAKIQGLQDQIDELTTETAKIQGLQDQIDELTTETAKIQGLQDQIDELKKNIEDLQNNE